MLWYWTGFTSRPPTRSTISPSPRHCKKISLTICSPCNSRWRQPSAWWWWASSSRLSREAAWSKTWTYPSSRSAKMRSYSRRGTRIPFWSILSASKWINTARERRIPTKYWMRPILNSSYLPAPCRPGSTVWSTTSVIRSFSLDQRLTDCIANAKMGAWWWVGISVWDCLIWMAWPRRIFWSGRPKLSRVSISRRSRK